VDEMRIKVKQPHSSGINLLPQLIGVFAVFFFFQGGSEKPLIINCENAVVSSKITEQTNTII
jgi:hypothetical protein